MKSVWAKLKRSRRRGFLIFTVFCALNLAQRSWTAEGILDYNRFMSEIEPLLLTKTYASPGPTPMTCFDCHGDTAHAAFGVFPLFQNQPRLNFLETARQVDLDSPDSSALLLKPLALAAGGTTHGLNANNGGEQFLNTTTDTSYRTIQAWIVDAVRSSVGARIQRTEPYPNPFRRETNIVYFLTTTAVEVDVKIYTSNGTQLRQFDGETRVGANRVLWDGRDEFRELVPTGLYFYLVKARFEDGTATKTGRIVFTP